MCNQQIYLSKKLLLLLIIEAFKSNNSVNCIVLKLTWLVLSNEKECFLKKIIGVDYSILKISSDLKGTRTPKYWDNPNN